MSIMAKLKEIGAFLSDPLLKLRDELDGGRRALAGLRALMVSQQGSEREGLDKELRMIEERLLRAEALLRALACQRTGVPPGTQPVAGVPTGSPPPKPKR